VYKRQIEHVVESINWYSWNWCQISHQHIQLDEW